jgi:hypothetical protein
VIDIIKRRGIHKPHDAVFFATGRTFCPVYFHSKWRGSGPLLRCWDWLSSHAWASTPTARDRTKSPRGKALAQNQRKISFPAGFFKLTVSERFPAFWARNDAPINLRLRSASAPSWRGQVAYKRSLDLDYVGAKLR